jgi:divalent metal cation (Fe/Co/Zn/Cd) transporter
MKYLSVLILDIAVSPDLSVEAGHAIATEVHRNLLHHTYLSNALIHIDPLTASGEEHHYVSGHDYSDRTQHSHK